MIKNLDKNIKIKKISVILPTLNEFNNIQLIYDELLLELTKLDLLFEIIFIDDNSSDGTIDKIKSLSLSDENVKYLIMSKRFGDQKCLMAGIDFCTGDAAIIMDSDLQHPPKYIPEMIDCWMNGADVVIMQRKKAGHKLFFKKISELFFYRALNWLSNEKIYLRFSGFSLIDKKVLDQVKNFKEYEPFLRGILSLVGFKHTLLEYLEDERVNGQTKYSFFKQISLALVGVTSFSVRPLYLSLVVGVIALLSSFTYGLFILINKLIYSNNIIEGWTSVVLLVIFFGGLQLITIGILGIYIGKNFTESKNRPRYIVNESKGFKNDF
jgi:polyisoprenyl-phosphate glycosyltransferase